MGIEIKDVRMLPDDRNIMAAVFKEALQNYDIVLTTGGLGPTFDDITAEMAADAADRDFVFYQSIFDNIKNLLESRGINVKENHKLQAYLPEGSTLFENTRGTAPGFAAEKDGSYIICMPGIPYEMKKIMEDSVIPFIRGKFGLKKRNFIDLRFAGIPESDMDDALAEMKIPDNVECIINVGKGELIVRFRSYELEDAEAAAFKLRQKFSERFIGYGDETMQLLLVRLLKEKGLTASFAESCTGGLIAADVTDVAGSSEVFRGSVVAYANDVKQSVLNVREKTLIDHGAVSQECADEMLNVADVLNTDIAASVTGIAGPDGGTEEKPVGTVYVGIRTPKMRRVYKYDFKGDRDAVRKRTVKTVFRLLIDKIREL